MFKIALDAGHGLHTGGKRCLKSLDPNETREWWLNNRICDEIERILESEFQKGVDYDLIRLDDTTGEIDISLDERVAKANNFNADYLLSIHHNAGAKGTSVGGPTVHIRPNRGNDSWQKMGVLWDNFIGQVNKLGFSNRMSSNVWVNRFKVISGIKDACLFECGFMDSRVDIHYILREDYAMAAARGFANGLIQIGGLTSTKEEQWQQPSQETPSDNNTNENTEINNNTSTNENISQRPPSSSSSNQFKEETHNFFAFYGDDYKSKPLVPYKDIQFHPQKKEIEALYKINILRNENEYLLSQIEKNASGTITKTTDISEISRGEAAKLIFNTVCYLLLNGNHPSDRVWEQLKEANKEDYSSSLYYNINYSSDEEECKAVEFLVKWGIIEKNASHNFLYQARLEKKTMRRWIENLYRYLSG